MKTRRPAPPPPRATPETPKAESAAPARREETPRREAGVPGDPFVRMVRPSDGLVVAVSVPLVIEKIMHGYSFIEGEPACPRDKGDESRCDLHGQPGWYPSRRAGRMDIITNRVDAFRVWGEALLRDRDDSEFGSRADLNWRVGSAVIEQYRRLCNLAPAHGI